MTRRDSGLTLIELVVAMAIFALVSVMGLQGITGMMQMRDRLAARADATQELARTLTLLRADLGAAVPLMFHPPGDVPAQSAIAFGGQGGQRTLGLSVAGQPELSPDRAGPGFARVVWQFDPADGALTRQSWSRLYPADRRSEQPQVVMLGGVTGFGLRSYWDGIGWVDGAASVAPADAPTLDSDQAITTFVPTSSTLPRAVEVTLDRGRGGTITIVEALQ